MSRFKQWVLRNMCRLVGYLGQPIQLSRLISESDHSLIVQSYDPQEMTAGTMNADGFGVGWYHPKQDAEPFLYRNTLPIWSDINLPSLSRYVESGCVIANARSATAGLPTDLSNCQPFQYASILGTHNGFIENFRKTLYRPIRDRLGDTAYQLIQGLTDSEHIFALVIDALEAGATLTEAVERSLLILTELGEKYQATLSADLIFTDGHQMVASRYADGVKVPTLYYLKQETSILFASEPLFKSDWQALPDRALMTVHPDLSLDIKSL